VPNKRTLILVSSLTTISLATLLLVASAFHRRKRKSPRTHGFLGQTRSTKGVDTTSSITYRQQLREKSQRRQPTPSQGAKTKAVTRTITNASASSKKDPTTTATIPSPIAPSSTSDSSAIISSSQTPKEEEISVSDEARKAGESLKELIVTAIKEAKDSAKGTGKRLKEQTVDIASTVDTKDVRSLGDNVKASVQLFEEIMIEIRKERYNEQIKLLDGYKDLLQTHIKVLDARGRMASKLKPGA
jgi:hypothetical protein